MLITALPGPTGYADGGGVGFGYAVVPGNPGAPGKPGVPGWPKNIIFLTRMQFINKLL